MLEFIAPMVSETNTKRGIKMKQLLNRLHISGEICMECIIVSVFMGMVFYNLSTLV